MRFDLLTPDISLLSSPTITPTQQLGRSAIDCKFVLAERVAEFIDASVAQNTRRAYQSDLTHFAAWGGVIPSSPSEVANYLAAHADTLSVATLARRVATLSKMHEARNHPNPCRSELVRATLRGIKRTRGTANQQAKPLLVEDLMLALDRMGDSARDARDRALLLIGFAGGFRRAELVGLDRRDIEHARQGIIITLRFSKTDQEGVGRRIGIPHGRTRHCAVASLEDWLTRAGGMRARSSVP